MLVGANFSGARSESIDAYTRGSEQDLPDSARTYAEFGLANRRKHGFAMAPLPNMQKSSLPSIFDPRLRHDRTERQEDKYTECQNWRND